MLNNLRGTKTRQALSLLLRYRLTRRLSLWLTLIYAFIYLWAIGDLNFHGWRPGFSVIWAQAPMEMLFKQRNLFYFEGIAIVNLPSATWLFSPVNLGLALLLGVLVGLNFAFVYLSIKRPETHQGRNVPTLLTSIPALLAGTTCSAPLILVLLAVQASAGVLAFFSVLVPIAFLLLLGALIFNILHTKTDILRRLVTK